MTMITPSYLGETIEYSSLHACRSTLEDPTFFWVSCIRALEKDGLNHALRYYFDYKLMEAFNVRLFAVFSGKLATNAITRQEQWFLVANYDGKLTPGNINDDYRDWQAISTWANQIAGDLELVPQFQTLQPTHV